MKMDEEIQMAELDAKKAEEIIDIGSPFQESRPTTRPEKFKYFMCKKCHDWNIVKDEDLKVLKNLANENKKKKVVHAELNHDLAIAFKKFAANFGNYNAAIAVLMNDFHKHNK
jgi:hypothetical protein